MIIGSVLAGREAVISVRLRGAGAAFLEVPTIVDNGFNDFITLPSTTIGALGLSFREEGRYTLADGTETVSRLFTGEIEWFGEWRRILIVEMDGGPLLGMAMLSGFKLTVEVVEGGRVEILPLPQ